MAKASAVGGPTGAELEQQLDEAFGPVVPDRARPGCGLEPAVEEPPAEDPRMGIPAGWPMIHTLMSRILADVGPVAKAEYNEHQRYNFRGVDSVVNAVNAAFKRHRVYPVSRIEKFELRDTLTTQQKPTREATLKVVYRFMAPDGSATETEVPGEALDTSDKTSPKAMSVALRIALLQMLLLPTHDPTTDHDYNTRDGVGAMSASTAALVLERLVTGTLTEVVGPVRACIAEHSAWDRPIPGDGGTWAANFADRLAWIIDEAPDHATLTDIHSVLTAAGLLTARTPGGRTMPDCLKARWIALRDLYANTLNHVMSKIMSAEGIDQLNIAVGCGQAAYEAGTLLEADLEKALTIADERRPKLPDYAPQPEAEPVGGELPTDDEQVAEAEARIAFLREIDGEGPREAIPYDERRKAFAMRAAQAPIVGLGEEPSIREAAVVEAIATLLTDQQGGEVAAIFGDDGYVLVKDAIVAAHRREHSIGDAARLRLEVLLAQHAETPRAQQ